MAQTNETVTRILGVTRLPSTINGNPRYLFHTTHGPFRTLPDAMDAYAVTDSWAGKEVRLTWRMYYGYAQVSGIEVIR